MLTSRKRPPAPAVIPQDLAILPIGASQEIAMKLEIKKIGNSTGLILPKELLARLRLTQGDWV